MALGVALWLAYGIARDDLAIGVTNALTLVSLGLLITIKARAQVRTAADDRPSRA